MTKRKRTKTIVFDSHTHKRGRKHESRVPCLPEEIIFSILSWNSATFLHDVGRLVCKSWDVIVSTPRFIQTQLSPFSTHYFFAYYGIPPIGYRFQQTGVNFLGVEIEVDFVGVIIDSSVGCLLFKNDECLCVVNPVTKQVSEVPYPSKENSQCLKKINVAFISVTGELKVIFCYEHESLVRVPTPTYEWSVLTVGSNVSRRMLDSATLHTIPLTQDVEALHSVSVGSVVIYWKITELMSEYSRFLAVDLHSESFHLVHTPPVGKRETFGDLLPTNRQLYAVTLFSETCRPEPAGGLRKVRVWKMMNFHESEWVQVSTYDIDMELNRFLKSYRTLDFYAWLQDHEILIFIVDEFTTIAYNFKWRKLYSVSEHCYALNSHDFLHHTETLVSWCD